ncbi:MAG: ABC transporter [Blastopirellula sp.]|nr:MAG: ABC transporter [Blastopirellula sp.]
MILTLWIVYTASFFLMHLKPGGPFDGEKKQSPEIRKNLEAKYHFDWPLWKQYGYHLGKACRLDFGQSLKQKDKYVNDIIREGFPISATLGVCGLSLAVLLGISAGVVSALQRQTLLDFSFRTLATLGIAVPNFVLAGFAIIIFVFVLDWIPAAGWGKPINLILPSLCLSAPFAAYISRLTRTGLLEVLNQDYIRTAYAKGLMTPAVVFRHALRGALLPVVSFLGPATAGILTGSLVLERIFFIPGMGTHFIEAVLQNDHFVSLAIVMVYTVLLFTMNTLVDLSYGLIDPRVKLQD